MIAREDQTFFDKKNSVLFVSLTSAPASVTITWLKVSHSVCFSVWVWARCTKFRGTQETFWRKMCFCFLKLNKAINSDFVHDKCCWTKGWFLERGHRSGAFSSCRRGPQRTCNIPVRFDSRVFGTVLAVKRKHVWALTSVLLLGVYFCPCLEARSGASFSYVSRKIYEMANLL